MSLSSPLTGINLSYIYTNTIKMRIATAGHTGPLMLLVHGWPESWYSWRHQLSFFAEQGYHVVAPDMRGYGATDAPQDVASYDIIQLTADLLGILDAFEEERAVIVGHDWGAMIAWHAVLMHPERFNALIAMSVPYYGRPRRSPIDIWQSKYGDDFYYILYHNELQAPEAEYDANPRALLSRLYLSPDSPRETALIQDPRRSAGGWIDRLGAAKGLPNWLTQADLDYYLEQFEGSGFRGGLNYYRNFHRNWLITEHLKGLKVSVPTLFLAGEQDMVIAGAETQELRAAMTPIVLDLRDVILLPGIGHWVQQEAPEDTNDALLHFLSATFT